MTPEDKDAPPEGSQAVETQLVEKRRFVRIQPAILIEIRKLEDIAGFVKAHIRDISLGGMFVRAPRPKPVGTTVRFKLPYNHGRNFCELNGTVVRAITQEQVGNGDPEAGMAVEFAPMEITARAVLRRIIMEHLTQQGITEIEDPNNPRPPVKPVEQFITTTEEGSD